LWQAGSKGYSTKIILTLLAFPTTDSKIKITNEWRKGPLHKWKHAFKRIILKASSPRAKALELLDELPFDYFKDVPLVPSPHLRLVSRIFCPSNPVRFVAPNANDFVPNRIVVTRKGKRDDDPHGDDHSDSPVAKRHNTGDENVA
jgi:hypothetical protein